MDSFKIMMLQKAQLKKFKSFIISISVLKVITDSMKSIFQNKAQHSIDMN